MGIVNQDRERKKMKTATRKKKKRKKKTSDYISYIFFLQWTKIIFTKSTNLLHSHPPLWDIKISCEQHLTDELFGKLPPATMQERCLRTTDRCNRRNRKLPAVVFTCNLRMVKERDRPQGTQTQRLKEKTSARREGLQ